MKSRKGVGCFSTGPIQGHYEDFSVFFQNLFFRRVYTLLKNKFLVDRREVRLDALQTNVVRLDEIQTNVLSLSNTINVFFFKEIFYTINVNSFEEIV